MCLLGGHCFGYVLHVLRGQKQAGASFSRRMMTYCAALECIFPRLESAALHWLSQSLVFRVMLHVNNVSMREVDFFRVRHELDARLDPRAPLYEELAFGMRLRVNREREWLTLELNPHYAWDECERAVHALFDYLSSCIDVRAPIGNAVQLLCTRHDMHPARARAVLYASRAVDADMYVGEVCGPLSIGGPLADPDTDMRRVYPPWRPEVYDLPHLRMQVPAEQLAKRAPTLHALMPAATGECDKTFFDCMLRTFTMFCADLSAVGAAPPDDDGDVETLLHWSTLMRRAGFMMQTLLALHYATTKPERLQRRVCRHTLPRLDALLADIDSFLREHDARDSNSMF